MNIGCKWDHINNSGLCLVNKWDSKHGLADRKCLKNVNNLHLRSSSMNCLKIKFSLKINEIFHLNLF